ncbi:MAG: ATP-binding cassette domain-containing protein, partial [Sphingomonadales bacterium]
MPEPILSLENAGLKLGHGWLFQGLGLTIDARDRLALIGRNGAGKSTLLKLIEGTLALDEGRRSQANGLTIGRLEQDPPMTGHARLLDYALAGGAPAHEVAAIADQLGLDLDRPVASASGGERRRAALARLLADKPQLLLMDEPTNHLDINAIEWLESWLDRSGCALVVISHDRAFLTRLTRNMLWLDRGQLRRAEVGFGGFDAWVEQVAAEDERTAQRLATKLRAEEHWLQRGVTARRKRNMGRLNKLLELRAERRALAGPQGVAKLAAAADERQTKVLIDAEQVSMAFGERSIIGKLNLRVRRGDRIGIIGPNGAGKSTLLKLLLGQLEPTSGSIRRAPNLDAIIIDQHRARLAPGASVRDVLADGGDWLEVLGAKKHLAGYLKEYLFDPVVIDAPVASFSGGEQARLLLARGSVVDSERTLS